MYTCRYFVVVSIRTKCCAYIIVETEKATYILLTLLATISLL